MKRLIIFAAVLTFFYAKAADLSKFPYYREAVTDKDLNPKTISAITLDSEFYSKTEDLRTDFRIICTDQYEIPFALRRVCKDKKKKKKITYNALILETKKIKGGVEIILKQMDNALAVDAIKLLFSAKNFEKLVDVEGSNDSKKWTSLVKEKAIYDYSGVIALRETKIKFPGARYIYFRVKILDFPEDKASPLSSLVKDSPNGLEKKIIAKLIKRDQPLKLDGAIFTDIFRAAENTLFKKRAYPLKAYSKLDEDNITNFYVRSKMEPLTQMTFSSASSGFTRNINISGSNDQKYWCLITSFVWTKSNEFAKDSQGGKLIRFPETRYSHYRISIENGKETPLKKLRVTAAGNVYRLVMLGEHSRNLKVYYGADVLPPNYEISRILPDIIEMPEVEYKLSERIPNPLLEMPQKAMGYKWLYPVLIIAASIFGIYIIRKIYIAVITGPDGDSS